MRQCVILFRSPLAASICTDRRERHEPGWPNCRVSVNPDSKKNNWRDTDSGRLPAWLSHFQPRRGLSNGHLQTILGNYLPRPALRTDGLAEVVEVDPADGSRVLCHCHWQAEPERSR